METMRTAGVVVGAAGRVLAVVLLGVVVLRLSGWSRGAVPALLLVALPLVLLPSYALAVVAVWRRDALLGAASGVLVAAHAVVVWPALGAAGLPDQARSAPGVRVVSANVLVGNPDLDRAAAALRALRPDVLVVAELRPASLAALRRSGTLQDLPFSTLTGPPGDVEIFSRLPLRDVEHTTAVPGLAQPRAVIEVAGTAVRIRGAHPLPPIGGYEQTGRALLAELREEVRQERLPLVVAGDINADRHFPLFQDLLDLGLRDAAEERGRGLSLTWPQRLPLLALDHVLVRDSAHARVLVLDQREAALPGSDHLAVVADLVVQPR